MLLTYLRRELANRRKQTVIVAAGMALAITLVIIVNSLAAGVREAQQSTLEAVYGVGTDIAVSQQMTGPSDTGDDGGGPQVFQFGAEEGEAEEGVRSLGQSRLVPGPGTATFDESALGEIGAVEEVESATAALSLQSVSFEGEIPDAAQRGGPGPVVGGPDAEGGSSFNIDTFSVLGIDPAESSVGPLSAVEATDGRTLEASDAGRNVAVLDANYAASADLALGDTISVAETDFEIVGLVDSTTPEADSAANVYVPLDVAQSLAELDEQISDVYVRAASATAIDQVKTDIEAALPDATVHTQEDLASTVSGSLGTAASLLSSLGTWLSAVVLAAAFLIAALLTLSGVSRRTQEFGTLKALGWSNRAVVGQIASESVVRSLAGGVLGAMIGVAGVLTLNSLDISLSAAAGASGALPGGDAPGNGRTMPGGPTGPGAQTATDIALSAPVSAQIILVAIALAVLGGVIAGALGGWRASRLSPAEALRTVA